MVNIIEVKDLKKEFNIPKKEKNLSKMKKRLSWFYREWEIKTAVEDINLEVKKGEILGYLGPNGAGKSTTIKMLTGILHPTSGSIKVMGNLNPIEDRNEYTQNIGVVFGQRSILAYDIPVRDSFRLFKAIYGLSEDFYQKRVEYLVEMLGIGPFFETPYRMLSLGEKMRCELAASFLHKPKIVFLDEPTIGLDAQAKIAIRSFLKKINKEEEVTIMITTHDMDDIEELCQRIVVIDKGTLAYEGSVKKFKETYANSKDVTMTYTKITNKNKWETLKKTIPNRKSDLPKSIIFEFPMNKSLGKFLQDTVSSVEIHDLSIQEPNLEHIIADMYNQATGDESLKKEDVLKKEAETKGKK